MQPTANDWFLPAIFTDGSVGDCLTAVVSELERRRDFVVAVKSRLEPGGVPGQATSGNQSKIDAVTDLSSRIKPLENTLRTRLPMLLPDRPAAWFRVPAARTSGPFATSVLHEPVFAPYGSAPSDLVREGLVNAWKSGAVSVGVFRVGIRCLWLTLLELNGRYRAINELDGEFSGLALDCLPDGLPGYLDCKSLRAFLSNVRNELQGCRQRLDACYRDLLAASDNYFAYQASAASQGAGAQSRTGAWRDRAEDFRDEQSRRRQAFSSGSGRAGATVKTAKDIEALRYFGFSDFPAQDELRKKYLELAKKYHPDSGTGHEEKFKTLSRVYEHLLQRCSA